MKLLNEQEPKDFQPFTLSIRVETVEDLATLWGIFNVTQEQVYKSGGVLENSPKFKGYLKCADDVVGTYRIFEYIDKKFQEYTKCK